MLLGGYYVMHYQNKEKEKTLEENVTMGALKGYEIFPPYKNPNKFTVKVKPGSTETIIYGITALNKYSFK